MMRFADDVNGLLSADEIAGMSGFDFINGILKGELPAPPICGALNYWLEEVEMGRVVFASEPVFSAMNPIGTIHGGWFGTVLDSCMACAVQTMLPKGRLYTTLEFKVNILRPILPDTGTYLAIGEVDHVGRRTGVSHGRIIGKADGKTYATGSTTCHVFEATPA